MGATRIQLCGPLLVRLDDRRLEDHLAGRQLRLLFVYLVLAREGLSTRERPVDALWGEAPPPAADAALSALFSRLRRSLPPACPSGRSEIRLVLPADAWVDYEQAAVACHRGGSARARGDWPAVFTASLVAYYIARRGFLPGEELPWVEDHRRYLAGVLLDARECFGEACLALGGAELPGALRSGRELIKLAPYRETGYRILMGALAAEGKVAEALRVYDGLRVRLADELGASPSPDLQRLELRLPG
ncbi:MAG: AfsR/SARP family transcriptional regulator [Actinomycetota bacterium]